MQIVGHRGAAGLATENTRDGLQAAIKAGVDWIEFDVRATGDGQVVVFHDGNTLRMSGKVYFISKTPLASLQRLRLHGGHSIPTLSEALNSIGGHAKILIEIKSAGCANAVVNNIRRLTKKGMRCSEFRVASFSPARLKEVQALDDKIPLTLLQLPHKPYRFLQLNGLVLKGVGFYHRLLPKRAIQLAEMHGLETYVFVVNSPRRAQMFAKLGVDMIGTNRPDLLKPSRSSA